MYVMVLKQRAYHRVANHDIGYFERLELQGSEPGQADSIKIDDLEDVHATYREPWW